MKKYLFALLICFQFSFSQNHLDAVLKQLKFKKSDINEKLVTEKILPYDKEKSVFVLPKYASEVTPDYFDLDAYILVIDNKTGTILYKFIEPSAWTSDAIAITNISIDTGLYILNKTTRAFGVRVNYQNGSNINPYSENNLSLYIIKKNSLKEILSNYRVEDFIGDWGITCAGESTSSKSTLDIDQLQNNNFNNLIVKTKTIKTKTILKKNDDCITKESIKNETSKLIFDGKVYK